jgi:hypothetical protein
MKGDHMPRQKEDNLTLSEFVRARLETFVSGYEFAKNYLSEKEKHE